MNDQRSDPNTSLTVLAVLGVVTALYFGSELLMPIAVGGVLSIALRPLVRGMKRRLRIPAPLGAAIVVLGLLGVVAGGIWFGEAPVKRWFDQAPQRLATVRGKLDRIRRPLVHVTKLANEVGLSGAPSTQPAGAATRPTPDDAPRQEGPVPAEGARSESAVAGALGTTRLVLTGIVEVLLLLYLLLASGNLFYRKLLKVLPRFRDKEHAAESVEEVENVVLRYLGVMLMITGAQGVVVAATLWFLHVPGAILWGLACLVLEFIPYLGATVMIVLLTLSAAATMDGIGHILAVPLSYLVITTLQSSVISPYVFGNRLKLNPVAVLVGVMFWWFVWGVPGAFLAVPIMATTKIIADRTDHWKPLGEFLGE